MSADPGSLFAPLAAAAERSGLGDFLRWWRGELAAMLPAGWRERLASRDAAYVSGDGDEWRVLRPVAGRLAQAGRVSVGTLDPAGRRGAFRRLLAGEPGAAGNVWLVLPRQSVLVREVALPLAAEEALRDAVGFELDRLTPLPSDQAWFDYRIASRDTASQRLVLTLAVAPRAPVESRLAELRELGTLVLGVGIEDDIAAAPVPLNLLPPERRDRPGTSGAALAARISAFVAMVLALAVLAYPVWMKREAVIALQPRMESARAGAEVASRLAQEIEKLASEHNFILARKQGHPPVVALLEDLSRLLPDATWVQQVDVKAGQKAQEVQIAGETGSSSQLIEVLERSGTFANATFKSPLTKGVTPGTERFLLAVEVKPRPLPEPLPESALLALPAAAPPAAPPPASPAAAPAAQASGAPAAWNGAVAPKSAAESSADAATAIAPATAPPAEAAKPAAPGPSAPGPAQKGY